MEYRRIKWIHIWSAIRDYLSEYDIVGQCETIVKKQGDFMDFQLGFRAFNSVRNKRKRLGRYSGGITVFNRDVLITRDILCWIFYGIHICIVSHFNTSYFSCIRLSHLYMCKVIWMENTPLSLYLITVTADDPESEIIFLGDFNERLPWLQTQW